jgi:hypothetical protein
MDSKSLYSSYSRYKADTDVVSQWLLTTATSRGFQVPGCVDRGSRVGSKTSRLKGKARKLARASTTAPSNNDRAAARTYHVKAHDLVCMAQFIAKAKNPGVVIPGSFIKTLIRAITTRKSHQHFYSEYFNQEQTSTQDSGHTYFIGVLESILQILRPVLSEEEPPNDPEDKDHSVLHSPVENMFASLAVEESEESVDLTNCYQVLDTAPKVKVDMTESDELKRNEAFMASTLLCRDVHRLRLVVQKIWQLYLEGEIDLVAASITTNTAIDFCRKLQYDFDEAFPEETKFHDAVCLYCAFLQEIDPSENTRDRQNESCSKRSRRILSHFIRDIEHDSPDVMPMVHPAHTELYKSTNGKDSSLSQEEDEFHVGFKLMMGILPELYAMVLRSPRFQAQHEIINALRYVVLQKRQSCWITFAMQLLLDIRHVLRENIGRGLQDLRRGGRSITASIKTTIDFHQTMGMAEHAHNDKHLREVIDLVDRWVEHDHIRDLLDREDRLVDPSSASHISEFYLLERDPLWCGLLLYNFRMVAHEGAIITANSWAFIQVTSHLYNSLRQTDMLHCTWDSMEHIMTMHGIDNLFLGSLPTTFNDCFKRCALTAGLSVTNLSRDARLQNFKTSPARQRKLDMLAPVSWSFKKRFCDSDCRTDLGPIDVMEILRNSRMLNAGGHLQPISPVPSNGILCLLGLHIHMETLETTFNHFEMHITCWKLLRQLHHNLRGSISEWSTTVYRDDRELPTLVLYLLMEAAQQEKATIASGISMVSVPILPLFEAVKLFEDLGIANM